MRLKRKKDAGQSPENPAKQCVRFVTYKAFPDESLSRKVLNERNLQGENKERILRKTTTYEVIERPFTTEPKIRRKRTGNRSVRRTAQELVDSWYPETEVSYKAMRLKLINQFERCSRQTVLAYLGRPETVQVEKIDQTVRYPRSGVQTFKLHTFKHKLPAKKGYLELFGLATLHADNKTGRVWFKLHHKKQTTLIPPVPSLKSVSEGVTESLPKKIFLSLSSVPVYAEEQHENSVLEQPIVENRERERVLITERKISGHEHIKGQICEEELRILNATPKEIPDRGRVQRSGG